MRPCIVVCTVLAVVFSLPIALHADVTLPAVIADNMVLQQEMKAPIWGRAEPGETVTVTVGTQQVSSKADAGGRWMVRLAPMKAGGGSMEMTVAGRNTITLKNVAVGEVWLASGQSNMSWPFRMGKVARPPDDLDLPDLRMFSGYNTASDTPQWTANSDAEWLVCGKDTIGPWAATAFFFARDLHAARKVPVGIIDVSWGGHPIEHFLSRETLASDPEFARFLKGWTPEKMAQAKRRRHPSSIWNCKVVPAVPYGMRGVIWWQGEWNIGTGEALYAKLFATLIRDWRRTWGQGDFPFLFVQLQRDKGPQKRCVENSGYADVRAAQLRTLAVPNTAMVVITDVEASLHPRSKDVVGHRLALAAEALVYGKDVEYSGPIFDGVAGIQANRVRLTFKHTAGGLMAKGGPGAPGLKGFAVAGADRRFARAEAKIDGETVVVWSKDVPRPVAVRYAWADNPDGNLFSEVGLPASPFRTDDWPAKTVQTID